MTEDTEPHDLSTEKPKRFNAPIYLLLKVAGLLILTALLAGTIALWYVHSLSKPAADFPTNQNITIAPGTDVRTITEQMQEAKVVKSAQLLYFTLIFSHDPSNIKASTYVFDEPLDTFAVAKRLTEGDFDTDLLRFTHFEGERASAVSSRAGELFENFDEERFLANTTELEGKLFPETYFIPPSYSDQEILALLLDTYTEKMSVLQEKIAAHPLTEAEVIILASIIEREANTPESMKLVSGILQNRLEINMALQADASIEYVIETPLGQLPPGQLAAELRELDSPYNTYLYTGLPPTPIGNPGLDAITAVLEPTESDYFYYITSDDGIFYYSETYDQHLRNISLYLR